jgi:hypothetical protein
MASAAPVRWPSVASGKKLEGYAEGKEGEKQSKERTYPRERCDILQRSCFGSGGSDNNAVLHGVVLLKSLDELGDSGSLLADGNVDTVELLLLVGTVVPSLLVQHSIESDGSLSGLTVTDNQLTLTTTDRHHGVDGLETSLDWLLD